MISTGGNNSIINIKIGKVTMAVDMDFYHPISKLNIPGILKLFGVKDKDILWRKLDNGNLVPRKLKMKVVKPESLEGTEIDLAYSLQENGIMPQTKLAFEGGKIKELFTPNPNSYYTLEIYDPEDPDFAGEYSLEGRNKITPV